MTKSSKTRLGFAHLAAITASAVMFTPVYLVIINSLKTRAEASTLSAKLPASPQFGNFATVVEKGNLVEGFFNSLIYSSISTILATLVAAMAAFVLSRHRTRFNRFLYFFLIMASPYPSTSSP